MTNSDTQATWTYHDRTKHSPESVRRARHVLEWDIMPRPFKVYVDLDPIPLPRDFTVSTRPALSAIAGGARSAASARLDLTALGRLLHFSAGVLRHRTYPGGEIFFRAAACTGALYHIDLYAVTAPLDDLDAGVYHFSPHDFSLRCLRRGDQRHALVQASGGNADVAGAPVVLICTSTFWRNAWKYQARAYRHCYWDSGTILANLLAVAAAADVKARVALGFVDGEVNALLDLDTQREVSLALVALGDAASPAPAAARLEPLGLATLPPSAREVGYPEMRDMHAASSLSTAEEVRQWARAAAAAAASEPALSPEGGVATAESIEAVILRRGSSRRFRGAAITAEDLSAILRAATSAVPADFVARATSLADVYVIANRVDGLQAGAYVYNRAQGSLLSLRLGDFRREAGFLDLGQDLARDADVNLYWLADLPPILARLGNRGYRAAQLDAAIGGGRAYLASYALRLGATGLTFFDDDVVEFFSPHAAGKSVMFLMAVGRGR